MKKQMNKVREIGDQVKTKWDDSVKPIPALIVDKYRGHRKTMYVVLMKDGTTERISDDQIL